MTKLFKFMKQSWKSVIVIVFLLLIQALCDLSLPSYTSDIVNVGIQQGGVEEAAPRVIRESEFNKLLAFTRDNDQDTIKDSYKKISKEDCSAGEWEEYKSDYPVLKKEPVYVIKELKKKELEKVETILGKPMLIVSGLEGDSKESKEMQEKMMTGMAQGQAQQGQNAQQGRQKSAAKDGKAAGAGMDFTKIPREQMNVMLDEIDKQFENMPDSMISQASTSYIKAEYGKVGLNTDDLQNDYIFFTGLKMLGLSLLGMVVAIMVGFLASRAAASIGRDVRGRVFKKVVSFSNTEFDKFSTASLITRSTNDVQQVQMLIVMLLRMVLYAPIMGVGGVIKVLGTNTSMAWIIGLAVGMILVVVIFLFAAVMPKFKIMQKLVDRLNLVTREILTGLSVIRAFSTEKYEEKRFETANRDLMKTQLFVNRVMTCMMPAMMLIMNVITVLIVWNGAHSIDKGQMQVGDMMAFMQYTMQIIMSFLMISMISVMLPRASVSAVRIDEILNTDSVILDPKDKKKFLTDKKGYVEFKNVSFRYPGAEEDVLHDINFTARPGETTAIIGSTGSGKSTLINLIPRFYDVTEGHLYVDGVDVRDADQAEIRRKLGYVPQKGVLFSGDISSNILYGREDENEEAMKKAAEIAQAQDFIEEKPDGYESHIAQGGSNVSGGQKQRLSIARAIARDPEIYIFDDSFSALDYKTDVTLRKALKEETADSTVIIVAQRISTILHAEQIIVLDDGKIAGIGTHKELLKNCEVYQQIASSQLSKEELGNE